MAPKILIRVIWCPSAYNSWAFGTLLKNEKKRRPLKPNTMTHIDENIQSQNYSLKSSLSLFSCWISGFTQRKCGLCSQGSSLLASIKIFTVRKNTAIIRWPPRRRHRFATSFLGTRPRVFHPPTREVSVLFFFEVSLTQLGISTHPFTAYPLWPIR